MKEYKVFIWIGIFMVIVVLGLIWLAAQSSNDNLPTAELNEEGVTLFYGKECPHCIELDKFIKENNIEEKVTFDNLEVWHDKGNAKLMEVAATKCELDLDSIGVPFLFAKGECYIGGPDVEEFFKKEAGI